MSRGKSSRIRIAVRIRPLSEPEEAEGHTSIVERINDNGVRVWDPMAIEAGLIRGDISSNGNCWIRDFYYDFCLWSVSADDQNYADQSTIFSVIGQPVVNWTMENYNTCILAYGQTGAGKSYTMLGSYRDAADYGLIPRICFALFDRLDAQRSAEEGEYFVDLSFLEIYNETLRDCLDPSTNSGLRLRENTSEGVYVSNLTREQVHRFEDVMTLIAKGNKYRTVAATNANARSSRSHAIVTLTIRQRYRSSIINGLPSSSLLQKTSKMHLVDLAGSERSSHSGATGMRLREANNINRSLSVLGDVIKFLGEGKSHIPYRNSSLTMVLKESLGGNSHTTIIAAVSPSNRDYNETISTLKYADSAKRIKMHVAANVTSGISIADGANAIQLVPLLQAEVAKLKEMLQEQQNRRPPTPPLMQSSLSSSPSAEAVLEMKARVEELERQLLEREELIKRLGEASSGDLGGTPGLMRSASMSDVNESSFLNTSTNLIDESMESSRKSIVHPLVLLPDDPVNINLPRIVNLNQDPLFSECLVYYIPEGFIVAGNDEANVDIFLSGPDLLSKHCVFHNHGGVVYIGPTREVDASPIAGERGRLFINGVDISGLRDQANSWRHPDPSAIIEGGLMRLSNYDRIAIGKYHLFRFENLRNKSPRVSDAEKALIPDWEFAHHELLPHILSQTAISVSLSPPRIIDEPIMYKQNSPKKIPQIEDTRRVRFSDETALPQTSKTEGSQSQADFRKMMRKAFETTAEHSSSSELSLPPTRFADFAVPSRPTSTHINRVTDRYIPTESLYDAKVVVQATKNFDDEVESLQNELSRMHQNLQERMKKYKAMSRT